MRFGSLETVVAPGAVFATGAFFLRFFWLFL